MKRVLFLAASHVAVLILGFAAGIYTLPLLIAPPAPTAAQVQASTVGVAYKTQFRRDLKDSDALHWGEGVLAVGSQAISLAGNLSPGPDYKLYLSPEFVETEADFKRLKDRMVRVADVKTFKNFVISVPAGIDIERYNSVIIWCETFGEFITAAKYK